jgi:hypothetical protein
MKFFGCVSGRSLHYRLAPSVVFGSLIGFRIDQFGETGVIGKVLEIGVIPRLEPVSRIKTYGFGQTF